MRSVTLFLFMMVGFCSQAQVIEGIRGEFRDSVTSFTNNTDLELSGKGTGSVFVDDSLTVSGNVVNSGTGALKLHSGTTAQRPGSPANGMLRNNTTTNKIEAYENSSWKDVITSGDISFGTDNQIPFTNSAGDDFEYSANLTYDGAGLDVAGSLSVIRSANEAAKLEVHNSETGGLNGHVLLLKHLTDGDMNENFATEIRFLAEDDTSGEIITGSFEVNKGEQDNTNDDNWQYNIMIRKDGELAGILDLETEGNRFGGLEADFKGSVEIDTNLYVGGTVDLNGGTIDGTVIGGTTPAAGTFTTGTFTGRIFGRSGSSFSLELRAADLVGDNYMRFVDSGDSQKGYIGYGGTGTDVFSISNEENAAINFFTNGINRGEISSSGAWSTNGGSFAAGATTVSSFTNSATAGTGTRLKTATSAGVDGAITNGTDGQVMTMVSGSPAWATGATVTEGTFTPTLLSSGGGESVTYAYQSGYYIRIGNQVTIWVSISPSSVSGGSGNTQIGGLPENLATFGGGRPDFTGTVASNGIDFSAGYTQLICVGQSSGSTTINIHESGDAVSGQSLPFSAVGNNDSFDITLTYVTD